MYVIVRQGKGKYYTSAVFGYFHDVRSTDSYQRYLESVHSPYYIVWNEEKTHLVKVFAMEPNTEAQIPQVLIVDDGRDGWVEDLKKGMGCVSFLNRELADRLVAAQEIPPDLLAECRRVENAYAYDPCPEINTEKDIENLEAVFRGFHDASIRSCSMQDDGVLHVCFEGIWGCDLEVWFWGDVSYCMGDRDSSLWLPYWSDGSVFFQDGFIYLVDDVNVSIDRLDEGYCWFKAKHMRYRVIPE